jgi:hypothetical protein
MSTIGFVSTLSKDVAHGSRTDARRTSFRCLPTRSLRRSLSELLDSIMETGFVDISESDNSAFVRRKTGLESCDGQVVALRGWALVPAQPSGSGSVLWYLKK